MDVKEVTKEVTEEIKKDEELLLRAFQLEKFVKKYKKLIISAIVLIFAAIVGNSLYKMYKLNELAKRNNALDRLLENPNDKEALEIVKKDKNLYSLYMLYKGEYSKITSKELKDFRDYKLSLSDMKKLKEYVDNPNSYIFKDFARLVLMRYYLQNHNRKLAKVYKDEITPNSKLKEFSDFLYHYGVSK